MAIYLRGSKYFGT